MLIANNDGAFNADVELETVEHAKAFVLKQSDAYAAYIRRTFLDPISPYEASSWPLKLAEAKAYTDDASAPAVALEAMARGVNTAELVAKILAKAAQLAQLEAVISGTNGRHNDTIKALNSIEDLKAYDWRGGYPDVAG